MPPMKSPKCFEGLALGGAGISVGLIEKETRINPCSPSKDFGQLSIRPIPMPLGNCILSETRLNVNRFGSLSP